MKVAILGAGPAGLACAIECERLGVQAELFERNADVGILPMQTLTKYYLF